MNKTTKTVLITCMILLAGTGISSGQTVNSISVYELSPGLLTSTFLVTDPALFDTGSVDFYQLADEQYDLYISDQNGTLNSNGSYLTITCTHNWDFYGISGANNIDAVSLNLSDGSKIWASTVASYILGFNQSLADAKLDDALGEPDGSPTYVGSHFSSITLGFGLSQPIVTLPFDIWTSSVSLPLKFTHTKNMGGDTVFISDKGTFTGTIQTYILERNLVLNQNGCYLNMISDDEKLSMCFNQVAFISQEWPANDKKPEGFMIIGTGEFTLTNGTPYTGPISLDAKGTWKDNSQKQFMKIKGTVSGGDNCSFVFKGSFNASLSK